MKLIVSSAVNNSNVRAILSGFLEAKMLHEFYTPVASFPGSPLDLLGAIGPLADIRRRRFDLSLKPITRSWPWLEFGRQVALKRGWAKLIETEKGPFSIDAVFQKHDQIVKAGLKKAVKQGVSSVYSYEGMALNTFTEAKELGLQCIYDLPIAYWETGIRLLTEEMERLPQWKSTLGGAGINESAEKLERKVKEMELADVVVVSGDFVKNSIPDWAAGKPTIVSPFGTPTGGVRRKHEVENSFKNNERPLRVLFAGSMGQRKGLSDLFKAIQVLNTSQLELVVLGLPQNPMKFYKGELSNFTYEPVRPHDQVLELMSTCDVFCLPSIVEGRALVMQEAMSQGLPLIITPNTGGSDLIIEGKTGFLVPIRSPEAIAEKLTWFLENRSAIPEMGRMAQEHAAKYTWENYQAKIVESITQLSN
ncbi:glycosyltransferase family 4 protein [Pontibacter harenae]|uniref:glycosyltransferase family 4 protein n=1 Tax=Pontibacter harenae TaxID=2894083 RepID=UPI001E453D48|nr:glycosyltransferase family 4 protein [Pontibacter harenae]MCC9167207.1 glycosyltransferase family 4 protein [Pontibacter harenae]